MTNDVKSTKSGVTFSQVPLVCGHLLDQGKIGIRDGFDNHLGDGVLGGDVDWEVK